MFMKHKFIIVGPVIIAVASVCFLQPVIAAEEEEKASENKTEKSAETKSAKTSLSSADKKFAQNAAKGGMMEVAWGKAASERAMNSEVKQFGARMVRDHSKANNELKSIASKKGITLPNEEPSANFKTDAVYMDMMVKDHQEDLAEFQKEAKNGSDPDLKKFADKGAKMVAEHLSMAQRINKELKRNKSSLTR
jgi:putative membrane protein